MCKSPIKVVNPYFRRNAFQYQMGDVLPLSSRFVSQKDFIEVPCGKCADCRHSYFSSIMQRGQMEALSSYVYMVTLTYNDDHLPFLEFSSSNAVSSVEHRRLRHRGQRLSRPIERIERIYYADISHIRDMVKRLRNVSYLQDRDFRYLTVTEFGSKRFRPHHHMLLFVARRSDDVDNTPYLLLSRLSEDIQNYYAVNVGTRKNPIYEKLFTPATSIRKGKIYSTFDIQLVHDKSSSVLRDPCDPTSVAKALAYTLSYFNKTSRYDDLLQLYFDDAAAFQYFDKNTFLRLKTLLKSRCIYSKHFGFGFTPGGRKVVPSVKSFSCTADLCSFSGDYRMLPDSFSDFKSTPDYPEYERFFQFLSVNPGDSLVDFFAKLPHKPRWRLYAAVSLRYEPGRLRSLDCFSKNPVEHFSPKLLPRRDYDSTFETSATYCSIRRGLETALPLKLPYLAFEYVDHGKFVYTPLCKYFKRYCTTFEDISRLYRVLGVSNFDEYQSRFEFCESSYRKKKETLDSNTVFHEINRNFEQNSIFSVEYLFSQKFFSIFVPRFR